MLVGEIRLSHDVTRGREMFVEWGCLHPQSQPPCGFAKLAGSIATLRLGVVRACAKVQRQLASNVSKALETEMSGARVVWVRESWGLEDLRLGADDEVAWQAINYSWHIIDECMSMSTEDALFMKVGRKVGGRHRLQGLLLGDWLRIEKTVDVFSVNSDMLAFDITEARTFFQCGRCQVCCYCKENEIR